MSGSAAPGDGDASDVDVSGTRADSPGAGTADDDGARTLRDRLPTLDRTTLLQLLLGVTALSVAVRLVDLGGRAVHWDEGRVLYWALRYHETGHHAYRPIVHGPFLPVVNDVVFGVVGPTDFAARLPVAIVGGLFPLVAWLLRDRLRPGEVLALALVLAANPLLVYYSRFARNDVLVAAFATVALALAVRGHDRGDPRSLVPSGVALGLAFTTKENALLYVACYAGALALLLDHRLLRDVRETGSARGVVLERWPARAAAHLVRLAPGEGPDRGRGRSAGPSRAESAAGREGSVDGWGDVLSGQPGAGARRLAGHGALAGLAFLLVVVFFYAPRPALWSALGDPGALGGVVREATLGSWSKFVAEWGGSSHQAHDYLPFLRGFLETAAYGAPAVVTFAVVGVAVDWYVDARRRALVAFATYWGVASVLGYPVATDIEAPWAVVHAVVPLSIPAAVGLAAVARAGLAALDPATGDRRVGTAIADGGGPDDADSTTHPVDARGGAVGRRSDSGARSGDPAPGIGTGGRDLVGAALAGLLLLAAAGGVAGANVDYFNSADPEDREVLQWAQPDNDLLATLGTVERVAEANDGPDVLFVGSQRGGRTLFHVADESSADQPPAAPGWTTRLPLPWYLARAGAAVTSSPPGVAPDSALADPPPVVIAYGWDATNVSRALDGYEAHRHRFKLWGEDVVVFVDRSAAGAIAATAPAVRPGAATGPGTRA
jgi:uncharacterized protein (TIGR03663 family)